MIDILLSATPLSIPACEAFVACPEAGGTVVFIGTVRDKTQGKTVLQLSFEAYEPMALQEMQRIAEAACARFGVVRVAIHHRLAAHALLRLGQHQLLQGLKHLHGN